MPEIEDAKFRLIGVLETGSVVLDRETGTLRLYSPDGDQSWTDESSLLEDRTVDVLNTGSLGVSSQSQPSQDSQASREPPFVRTPQGRVVTLDGDGKGITRVLAEQPDGTYVTLVTSPDNKDAKVSGLPGGSQQPVLDAVADTLDWLASPSATAGLIYTYSPTAPAAIWVLRRDAQSKTWTFEKKIVAEQGMRFGCISDDGSLLIHLGENGATVENVATGESRMVPTELGRVTECHAASNSFVLVERRMSAGEVRTRYEWVDATNCAPRKIDSLPAEAMISLSPEGDTLIVSHGGVVITYDKSGETNEYAGLDGRIVRPGYLHILNSTGSVSVTQTRG